MLWAFWQALLQTDRKREISGSDGGDYKDVFWDVALCSL
jgi:hypothetical protein